MSLRVLVTGGRDFSNNAVVFGALGGLHAHEGILEIIQGGATGADRLARYWGRQKGIEVRTYLADWYNLSYPDAVIRTDKFGKKYDAKAGHRRNQLMLDDAKPDLVVAFPGGPGTRDMIRRTDKAGVKLLQFNTWGECT